MRTKLAALLLALTLALPMLGQAYATYEKSPGNLYALKLGDMPDLTAQCKITVGSKGFTLPRLTDRDWDSYWKGSPGAKPLRFPARSLPTACTSAGWRSPVPGGCPSR